MVMLLLLPLWGCSSLTRPGSSTVILRDGAPDEDIDVDSLPDVVPRQELIRDAGNKTPYTVLGKTYHVNFSTRGFSQTGYASWYGKKFHGNKTSNGEIYDMFALSGAHRTLAIPSYVRVTNLENGLSTVIRINDRGPFHDGRIIDLSYAAAKKLGFHNKGTAKVHIEVLEPDRPNTQFASAPMASPATPPPTAAPVDGALPPVASRPATSPVTQTYLQLGAFSKAESAAALSNKVAAATGAKVHVRPEPSRSLYKVVVGPILDSIELHSLRKKLLEASFPDAHLVEF